MIVSAISHANHYLVDVLAGSLVCRALPGRRAGDDPRALFDPCACGALGCGENFRSRVRERVQATTAFGLLAALEEISNMRMPC